MIQRRAFTLVELLVVIAIIGLLSTVAVVSLSSSRVKARNIKRTADIKQLVTAFTLAFDTNGSFPASGGWVCISSACTGSWSAIVANTTVDAFSASGMSVKPTDSLDNNARGQGGYIYNNTWNGPNGIGVYITYTLEAPTSCAFGTYVQGNANYTQCAVRLDL